MLQANVNQSIDSQSTLVDWFLYDIIALNLVEKNKKIHTLQDGAASTIVPEIRNLLLLTRKRKCSCQPTPAPQESFLISNSMRQ